MLVYWRLHHGAANLAGNRAIETARIIVGIRTGLSLALIGAILVALAPQFDIHVAAVGLALRHAWIRRLLRLSLSMRSAAQNPEKKQ